MEYLSAQKAAELWNISARRVQKLCEEGRIPGAKKFGRSWMLPQEAIKPSDPRQKKKTPAAMQFADLANIIASTTMPYPKHDPETILNTLAEERLRLQYEAELAYLRGDFECTKRCYQSTAGDDLARLRASSVAIAAAISLGDYPFYSEIETFLQGIVHANSNTGVAAFAELCLSAAYVSACATNMVPDWLKDGDFSKLPPQAKPDAAYKRAKYFQFIGQFEPMLAVAQTALEFCTSPSGVTFHDVYFRAVCAIACHALGRIDEAKRWLMESLKIALPLGFITPFAESITAFGGLLEQCLEQEFPAYYGAITSQWEWSFSNWLDFHNRFTKNNITRVLTLREYELAVLAARRVPYEQIAKRYSISVGRLKNKMNEIYGKLYVSNRKELSKLIL